MQKEGKEGRSALKDAGTDAPRCKSGPCVRYRDEWTDGRHVKQWVSYLTASCVNNKSNSRLADTRPNSCRLAAGLSMQHAVGPRAVPDVLTIVRQMNPRIGFSPVILTCLPIRILLRMSHLSHACYTPCPSHYNI